MCDVGDYKRRKHMDRELGRHWMSSANLHEMETYARKELRDGYYRVPDSVRVRMSRRDPRDCD